MKKRGLTHIEWAISMGIFLIALIFFFILLRPGAKPAYEQEALMDIVEKNFNENFVWQVKKTPVFIKALEVPPKKDEPRFISVITPANWRFSKVEPETYQSLKYDFSEKILRIECNIGICKTDRGPIVVYYYPGPKEITREETVIIAKCNIQDKDKCEVELGSTENFEGISLDRIKKLNYKDLKKDWEYPESKEFAIYLNKVNITDNPEPGQQDNVFVKELRTWVLDKDGHRENAVVSLRTW